MVDGADATWVEAAKVERAGSHPLSRRDEEYEEGGAMGLWEQVDRIVGDACDGTCCVVGADRLVEEAWETAAGSHQTGKSNLSCDGKSE